MKNLKIRKKLCTLLLGATLALGTLTGCSQEQKVEPVSYEFTLDDMTNHEDVKLQEYINNIPFSNSQFRESYYNYVSEQSLKDTIMAYDYFEIEKLELSSISSLTDLRLFPNLKVLVLKDCDVEDYSQLKDLNLNRLEIIGANIDCESLKNAKTYSLSLYNCSLKNNDALSEMSSLESLSFQFCKIGNIEFIANLKKLNSVTLSNADVADFGPLANTNLNSLNINLCQVDDWSFIQHMTSLTELSVAYTNFEDFSILTGLKNLNTLDLSYSFINNLDGLEKLSKIKELNIDSCQALEDYQETTELKRLEVLNATNLEMKYDYSTDLALSSNDVSSTIYNDDDIKRSIQEIYDSIGITEDMSESEKVRLITLKVLEQLKYDADFNVDDTVYYNNNELESSIDGVGICGSYTGLTTALLNLAGIENYSIVGENIPDNENYMHRWNVVKIDGVWYGLDTTFLADLDASNIIASGQDSIYYLDEIADEDWEYYHYPYAMPEFVSDYSVTFAR